MEISETIVIEAPAADVYQAFADLDHWRRALPDVLSTTIAYDDGYNQEFTMTVDRPSGPETVRGFRYTRRPTEIEVWQTTPPPGLRQLTGRWAFEPTGPPTTRVVARRTFEPTAAAEGETPPDRQAIATGLRHHLRTNLDRFKRSLEPVSPV